MTSCIEQIANARRLLELVETRAGNLARRKQDLDAELAACDDERECGRIASARMDVAFELVDVERLVSGASASLALAAREEREPWRAAA